MLRSHLQGTEGKEAQPAAVGCGSGDAGQTGVHAFAGIIRVRSRHEHDEKWRQQVGSNRSSRPASRSRQEQANLRRGRKFVIFVVGSSGLPAASTQLHVLENSPGVLLPPQDATQGRVCNAGAVPDVQPGGATAGPQCFQQANSNIQFVSLNPAQVANKPHRSGQANGAARR
ncbi:uncharacterized protein LOC119766537 isoform X1 [Culex quinquefasciatus]|uniref:uncharacterized protein LOC119766537 isoform X1 n=1 Tax=Culex quinquefasciatus TaxID=7176 RepID=UPI0018E33E39|nr:uncharacterized protein LOC119766537 isoform X1 [Culex quinquefasciatus]